MNKKSMKIVISGNCQRYLLASVLAHHYPQAQVVVPEESRGIVADTQMRSLLDTLQAPSVWITQGKTVWAERILSALRPSYGRF